MHSLLALLLVLQAAPTAQPPATTPPVRGDRFQLMVPQGWRTLYSGSYVLLEHSSGASLLVERINRISNLAEYSQQQAERIMAPLGFATLGEPQFIKTAHDERVQYEIRGNRLAEHRRVLFQVARRDTGFFQFVYEAPEDNFDVLLTEAQGIVTSVQTVIEAPPPTRRTRR